MKAIRITLIFALAAALLAPVVGAQDDAETEGIVIELETHTEGSEFYFTKAGETEKNPTLTVPAGETVTIRMINKDAGYHNVATDAAGGHESEYVGEEGGTAEITFTAEAGEYEYWCVPHKTMGMVGTLVVEGDGTDAGNTDTGADASTNAKESPGAGAALAVLALAGLAGLIGRRD